MIRINPKLAPQLFAEVGLLPAQFTFETRDAEGRVCGCIQSALMLHTPIASTMTLQAARRETLLAIRMRNPGELSELESYFKGLVEGWDRPGDDEIPDPTPFQMGVADGSLAAMEIGAAMVEPGKGRTV